MAVPEAVVPNVKVVAEVAIKFVPVTYRLDKYDVDPAPMPPVTINAPDVVPLAAVLFDIVTIPVVPTETTFPPLVAT